MERIELRAFTQSELNRQLEAIVGAPPDPDFAVRLFERSEGNPFFSEELLAASSAEGEHLPPTIRDALIRRVEALSAPRRMSSGLRQPRVGGSRIASGGGGRSPRKTVDPGAP